MTTSFNSGDRLAYYDGIKTLAIFVVFVTHFINEFHPEYFVYWEELPWSVLLGGMSGSLGVAVFGVILGNFAYRSSEKDMAKYSIHRYLYFLICALFINGLYAAMGAAGLNDKHFSLGEVLYTSALLSDGIYATFWCIRPFFIASVMSRINGMARLGPFGILLEAAIFLYCGKTWVAVCIMGGLIACMQDVPLIKRLTSRRGVRLLVYAAAFILTNRPESTITFLIQGLCSVAVIIALGDSRYVRGLLENRALAFTGRITMAIYLIHVMIYTAVGGALITALSPGLSYAAAFITALAVSWIVTVGVSYPLNTMINRISGYVNRLADVPAGYIERKLYQ